MPCSETVIIEQWDVAVEDGAWNEETLTLTLTVARRVHYERQISSLSRRDATSRERILSIVKAV